jgi:acyl dehydratase
MDVGQDAPVISHTLTRTDFVRYAGASGDYNPMHHDEVKATAAGMPSVFGHGMLSMAILGRAITDWVGADAVARYQVRFVKQTWPDDTVSTAVSITDVRDEDGHRMADLDCRLLNQHGEPVVTGNATVRLPADA